MQYSFVLVRVFVSLGCIRDAGTGLSVVIRPTQHFCAIRVRGASDLGNHPRHTAHSLHPSDTSGQLYHRVQIWSPGRHQASGGGDYTNGGGVVAAAADTATIAAAGTANLAGSCAGGGIACSQLTFLSISIRLRHLHRQFVPR